MIPREKLFNFVYHISVFLILFLLFWVIFQKKTETDEFRSPISMDDKKYDSGLGNVEIVPTEVISPTPINLKSSGKVIEVSPVESIQKAIDNAQPGETIKLLPGVYNQDFVSKRSGTAEKPITITGSKDVVVKGGGKARVIEINHDHIILSKFTVDGLHGDSGRVEGYRDKLIYVLGKSARKGVTGLKILSMNIKNAGGECVRLRYFAQNNEIAYNSINRCGIVDFEFKGGGKNGEGIYIGTAPEQLKDGKNPTSDIDESNNNWIHHNNIDTEGNECVDIKEGSSQNIVEYNNCTGQKDKESAGLDSRGNKNIFRYNEVYGNLGAGIRLGGDEDSDGINNDVYGNIIRNNSAGGVKFQRSPQGKVCDNKMEGNSGGDAVGSEAEEFNPTKSCS